MEDKTIKCICGVEFVFTVGEQEFFKDKGFNPPRRCADCRKKKREEKEQQQQA